VTVSRSRATFTPMPASSRPIVVMSASIGTLLSASSSVVSSPAASIFSAAFLAPANPHAALQWLPATDPEPVHL